MSAIKEGELVPLDQVNKPQAAVIDVRDVIAERVAHLLKPVRALERLANLNAGLPGRAQALAYCKSVEEMYARYSEFVVADAQAAEIELVEQLNIIEAANASRAH